MAMQTDSAYSTPAGPPDGPSLAAGRRVKVGKYDLTPEQRDFWSNTYKGGIAPFDTTPGSVVYAPYGANEEAKNAIREHKGQTMGWGINEQNKYRNQFGYGQAQNQMEKYASEGVNGQGPGAGVDLHHDPNGELAQMKGYANSRLFGSPNAAISDVPQLAQLSKYASERLGTGLTPSEFSALQNPQIESVESQATQNRANAANTSARSGYGDPRLGGVTASRLDNQRMQSRADIGRSMTTAQLQRKKEIEDLTTNVAQQQAARRAQVEGIGAGVAQGEENARQYDVGAEENRRGRLEELLGKSGDNAEARREYDTGLVEARRQARLNRRLILSSINRGNPTTGEKVSAILGGVQSGISKI